MRFVVARAPPNDGPGSGALAWLLALRVGIVDRAAEARDVGWDRNFHQGGCSLTKTVRASASLGLALGGFLGLAGTVAPSDSLRGLAWGVDGLALVAASALLTVAFFRAGHDLVASGFLVFAVGQGLVVSGAAMDLARSTPSFGAGAGLWAVALILISIPPVLPQVARLLGALTAVLFAITALRIFSGVALVPTSSPLPYFAYPVFVATLGAWIWALLTDRVAAASSTDGSRIAA